jgi:hypothetical protein
MTASGCRFATPNLGQARWDRAIQFADKTTRAHFGSMAESVGKKGDEALGLLPQSGASFGSKATALLDLVCELGPWICGGAKRERSGWPLLTDSRLNRV